MVGIEPTFCSFGDWCITVMLHSYVLCDLSPQNWTASTSPQTSHATVTLVRVCELPTHGRAVGGASGVADSPNGNASSRFCFMSDCIPQPDNMLKVLNLVLSTHNLNKFYYLGRIYKIERIVIASNYCPATNATPRFSRPFEEPTSAPSIYNVFKSGWWDSNSQLSGSRPDTLPIELHPVDVFNLS